MAILGLDAVNRFFEQLSMGWNAYWNFWGVLGIVLFFVLAQGLSVWFYIKILKAMMNLKPRIELFVNRVMLFFD